MSTADMPEGEEPAHRVRDLLQPTGERRLGQPGGGVGHADPGPIGQPGGLAVVSVAAGHHHIGLAEIDGPDQLGDRLGRMLEVTVHDHGHPALGQPEPGHHGPAEAAATLAGLPVQHQDGQGRRLGQSRRSRQGCRRCCRRRISPATAPTGSTAARRAMRGSMFSRSLRVGMTTLMSMECTLAPR